MKVFRRNYKIQLFFFLFLTIYCAIDEGNIYVPMTLSEELNNLYNELKDLGYNLFDIKW